MLSVMKVSLCKCPERSEGAGMSILLCPSAKTGLSAGQLMPAGVSFFKHEDTQVQIMALIFVR
jgi:hypothetical protein